VYAFCGTRHSQIQFTKNAAFFSCGVLWRSLEQHKNDEIFFILILTQYAICGMIAATWTMTCCGDADAAAEAPPRLTSSISFASWQGRRVTNPPRRRKEAISWKTLFPAVANVVKVIWFRSQISAARELPSNTRPGSAPIPLACTISRSVMAISSSTNR
jgi:hypothetical protein